jgi:hypothetical protein
MGVEQVGLYLSAPVIQLAPVTQHPIEESRHDSSTDRDGIASVAVPGAFAVRESYLHQQISSTTALDGLIGHRFRGGNTEKRDEDGDHGMIWDV